MTTFLPDDDARLDPGSDFGKPDANGWRVIETAPRDGTEILACSTVACTDIMLVRFTSMGEFLTDSEIDRYIDQGANAETIEGRDWFFADFVQGDRLSPDCYPTHWMPLPKPPVSK